MNLLSLNATELKWLRSKPLAVDGRHFVRAQRVSLKHLAFDPAPVKFSGDRDDGTVVLIVFPVLSYGGVAGVESWWRVRAGAEGEKENGYGCFHWLSSVAELGANCSAKQCGSSSGLN